MYVPQTRVYEGGSTVYVGPPGPELVDEKSGFAEPSGVPEDEGDDDPECSSPLDVAAADRQDTWAPVWLADFDMDVKHWAQVGLFQSDMIQRRPASTLPQRFATRDGVEAPSLVATAGDGDDMAVGTISLTTGAVGTTFTVTGLSFAPTALIVWWNGQDNSSDNIASQTSDFGIGVATSTSRRYSTVTQAIHGGTSINDQGSNTRSDCLVQTWGTLTATDGRVDIDAFTADGFRLIIDDVLPYALKLNYVAIGGTTDATCGEFQLRLNSSGGLTSTTGLGFEPEGLLFFTGVTINYPMTNSDVFGANIMIGAASGSGEDENGVWFMHLPRDHSTLTQYSYAKSGECIAMANNSDNIIWRARLNSFDTDGFTLNYSAAASLTRSCVYLAIAGKAFQVGNFLTPTDTTSSITIETNGPADGLIVLSASKAESTADTPTAPMHLSMGAASRTSAIAMATMVENVDPGEVHAAIDFDKIYINIDTSGAVEGLMEVDDFDDDAITLQMTDADPTASFAFYIAVVPSTPENVRYDGLIINNPKVDREYTDTFFGVMAVNRTAITLVNGNGDLNEIYERDCRGTPLTLRRYDLVSETLIREFSGIITEVAMGEGVLDVEAVAPDLSIFEQELPKGIVTVEEFGDRVVDVGHPLPVIFGEYEKHRCLYVNDDIFADEYDYIVARGEVTVEAVYRDSFNNTYSEVDPAEFTVSTTRYEGFTSLRFTNRQVNFQNAFHQIYADVTGFSTERNFARAIETLLSNTEYGLSQPVNADSFNDAAEALDDVGDLYCDACFSAPRQAQDILADLLSVRGMRLDMNSDGEWTISVDGVNCTAAMAVRDGSGHGERNIVRASPRRRRATTESMRRMAFRYRIDPVANTQLEVSRVVHDGFGRDLIIENIYVRNSTTADKIVDYRSKRELYASEEVEFEVTQEGRALEPGDIVQVTYAPFNLSERDMEVVSLSKTLDRIAVRLRGWSTAIYNYDARPTPDDGVTGEAQTIIEPVVTDEDGNIDGDIVVGDGGTITPPPNPTTDPPEPDSIYQASLIKACGKVQVSGSTHSLAQGFNVTSITDGALGIYTVTFDTDFANTNYGMIGGPIGGSFQTCNFHTYATGSAIAEIRDGVSEVDIPTSFIAFLGDQ